MSEYVSDMSAVAENLQAAIGHLPIESLLATYEHTEHAARLIRDAGVGRDPLAYSPSGMLSLADSVIRDTFLLARELGNARTELESYLFIINGGKNDLPPPVILPYKTPAESKNPGELAEYQQRAATVRDLIDPERTLPVVALIKSPHDSGEINERQDWYINHNGKTIGVCTVSQDHDNKTYHFRNITLYQNRGQGLGMATYLAVIADALRAGYTFQNDPYSQTESAKKVWESLTALGVAREVTPFYKVQFEKYQGFYIVDGVNHKKDTNSTGQKAA